MAMLEFIKGVNQGTRKELVGDRIVFGRNADCGVVLNAPAVSREHAVIRKISGKYFIEDMNSRNGTELNGPTNKIKVRTQLKDGDQIGICGNVMIYYDVGPKPKLPEHMKSDRDDDADDKDNSTVEATIQSGSSRQILEAAPSERLALLLEVGAELTQTVNTEDLLLKIVDKLFQVFRQADRGFIILKEDSKLLAKVTRTRRPDDDDKVRFSRKIVNRCMETSQGILSEDASSDAQFDMSQSIADCKIRSMVVAPLRGRGEGPAFGVIQLDTQDRFKKFSQDDLKLLMAVAAQAGVAIENARMLETLIEQAGLKRDLELATQVQKSFLPKKFPQATGYEFWAHYESALDVGGDYYDFIPLQNNRLGIMIGDVAGKGVPAALLMAKVSSDARFCTLTEPSLSEAIAKLNEHLQEAGQLDRFVTFGACLLDLQNHSVTVVSAGHQAPVVYRAATKSFEDGCSSDQAGLPLGIVEGIPYDCNTITLGPGDTVTLFTDGVSESRSVQEKDFGMEGVYGALKPGPMTPKEMGVRLVEAVKRHATGRKPHDDLTVVTFGRLA
ncbi:MAG TPA: SpoIIE family protein phosphatase [Gemmataceae bacterium]|nr:SpoIIE family protein phosphatase [Gemmataceae bacterium]